MILAPSNVEEDAKDPVEQRPLIVVAGGSGRLGRLVVPALVAANRAVRILSRDPDRARRGLSGSRVLDIRAADVRRPATLVAHLEGATTLVSLVQGFGGIDPAGPRAVDREGNVALIRAARQAGVERLVLLSISGARADHPMGLMRDKFAAEEAARSSGLPTTIVRPTAYMETWADIIGGPILAGGAALLFGRGRNPINFVSARDVAPIVLGAVLGPSPAGTVIEIAGPENVTLTEFAERFGRQLGREVPVRRVPRPVLRLLSPLLRVPKPALSSQVQAAVVMDTADMTIAGHDISEQLPGRAPTSLDVVIRETIERAGGIVARVAVPH